jgi:hypothetical protein
LGIRDKDSSRGSRDQDKLRKLLKAKQREGEEDTMKIEDIERLVTEIEMLRFALCVQYAEKFRESQE